MTRLRRLRPVVPLAAALLLLCSLGCQLPARSAARPSTDPLQRILERGTLRVGLSGQQPPLNMKTPAGRLIGLDVDLAVALAEQMNVEVEFVERPFGDLLSTLEAGEVDLVISDLTITAARNARVAFAGPYLISGATLIVKRAREEALDEKSELDRPEHTFSALESSTGLQAIAELAPNAKARPARDFDEALDWLMRDEVDGVVADLPFATFVITTRPEAELAMFPRPFTTEPIGIALPPDAPLLVNLVQNYLNTLDYTGRLMQLKAKWLNPGEWIDEME